MVSIALSRQPRDSNPRTGVQQSNVVTYLNRRKRLKKGTHDHVDVNNCSSQDIDTRKFMAHKD